MKIKRIESWVKDLENSKPYTIAFKTIDAVKNVIVRITLDNGVTGLGSGNPSEYVTGESFESAVEALDESKVEFLVGRDITAITKLLEEVRTHLKQNPAAAAAVDIALYDALTKSSNIPLVKFLGQKIDALPTSYTIGIKSVEETLADADYYLGKGFRVLKIKLGLNLEQDIERLIKVREIHKNAIIRIDANQGYTFDDTIKFYNATKALNIELIEQPLNAKQVDEMRLLPDELRERVAMDESLISAEDAVALVQEPKPGNIFNIKLMKCGGIHQALKIANIALSYNVKLFWGCNDESIISITAALHAAYSCSNTKYIDLDGSLDLSADVVQGGFILKDGIMYCSDEPGLGVSTLE